MEILVVWKERHTLLSLNIYTFTQSAFCLCTSPLRPVLRVSHGYSVPVVHRRQAGMKVCSWYDVLQRVLYKQHFVYIYRRIQEFSTLLYRRGFQWSLASPPRPWCTLWVDGSTRNPFESFNHVFFGVLRHPIELYWNFFWQGWPITHLQISDSTWTPEVHIRLHEWRRLLKVHNKTC